MDELLKAYGRSTSYPFHMPGHKRQTITVMNPYEIDITEIDGFDNLHHATGVIAKLQQDWADLYGCKRAFLLVNGTTCGNEAAIFAGTREGDTVIVGRGCHKSVYHAMALRHLNPEYIQPTLRDDGIPEPVTTSQVQEAIKKHPKATAIILTSPTYEGLCADIEGIAEAAHAAGMRFIVDAAHGAHFGLHPGYPKNPVSAGADAVIVSLHKTLPTFTQTACLLLPENSGIAPERIQKYLGYFESSSPSYILMASAAAAHRYIKVHGKEAMEEHLHRLGTLREHCANLKHLSVAIPSPWESGTTADPSKVIIVGKDQLLSGESIMTALREEAQLELEMATPTYALAMTSFMDTEEGYKRLENALFLLDEKADAWSNSIPIAKVRQLYEVRREIGMPLSEATEATTAKCSLKQAAGHMAGGFISLYPPGIPVYAPGERLEEAGVEALEEAIDAGFAVDGVDDNKNIEIIIEA
ncbi:MAG: aminotransferase class V-fold PLP-dependent enzyme [Lachnospiraceae bacterium]|nr:aminotransferase class V-fold PLP-dependent enzyme [Lachnospiraceae bacterium]